MAQDIASTHGQAIPNARAWATLGFVHLGLSLLAIIASLTAESDSWWFHAAWCVVGIFVSVTFLIGMIRRDARVVITNHFVMFAAAFALYFLFGASYVVFGSEDGVSRVLSYYHVDAVAALRADSVNSLGFGIALLVGATTKARWIQRVSDDASVRVARIPAEMVIGAFFVLGLGAFLYTLMYDFGFREDVVPGSVRALSKLSLVAIFLGASFRGAYRRMFVALSALMTVALSIAGLLMFNKTQVLLPICALVAGLALVVPRRVLLAGGAVVVVGVYVSIGGVVKYGRNTIGDRVVGVSERLNVVMDGLSGNDYAEAIAVGSGWARLCYIPSQGAGMDFYDQGNGGTDFSLIPWVFVPRALAPNKPVITEGARLFHEKIRGNRDSSTGQGIFSSGYYNGGWLGVVLAGVIAGWILAQTSAVARAVMARRATALLPLALYGIYIAFRIDGAILPDYIGAFVFILYPAIFYRLVTISARSGRRWSGK